MKTLLAVSATILVAGGCLLAYPGQDGRHLAGLAIIIAGLECATALMRTRIKEDDKEDKEK